MTITAVEGLEDDVGDEQDRAGDPDAEEAEAGDRVLVEEWTARFACPCRGSGSGVASRARRADTGDRGRQQGDVVHVPLEGGDVDPALLAIRTCLHLYPSTRRIAFLTIASPKPVPLILVVT